MKTATVGVPQIGRSVRRNGRWLLALVLAGAITACAPVYRNHGYVPTEQELSLLEVGKDTRDTVAEKVGRPTAAGLLDDLGWYYVQSRYRHFGPREPQEVERQVLAVTFTESGTLQNVERFGLADGKVVSISRRVTDTNIRGIGLIQQLFANFGRVGAGSVLEE